MFLFTGNYDITTQNNISWLFSWGLEQYETNYHSSFIMFSVNDLFNSGYWVSIIL
jgi:hypothetical protein